MESSDSVPREHDHTDAHDELNERSFAAYEPDEHDDEAKSDEYLSHDARIGLGRPQVADRHRCHGRRLHLAPTRPRSIAHHSRGSLRNVCAANSSAMKPTAWEYDGYGCTVPNSFRSPMP